MSRNTVIVNAFAGPGAGKTTAAWEIASKLKKSGLVVEYVSEYAKELVWDGNYELLDGTIQHETEIYQEKKRRIDRLIGKVDIVVTDSPTIQSISFLNEDKTTEQERKDFHDKVFNDWNQYRTFNFFIKRNPFSYEEAGRIQSIDEAKKLDEKVKTLLDDNGVFYGVYSHSTVDLLIKNIQKHYSKNEFEHQNDSKKNLEHARTTYRAQQRER